MEVLRCRGRGVTDGDVAFISDLIARHPTATRRALSRKLCQAWNWVQPNGVLRDMVCRGAEAYDRAEKIVVPHESLKSGDRCPDCQKGKVYEMAQPGVLVRVVGQAPVQAKVYGAVTLPAGRLGAGKRSVRPPICSQRRTIW